MKVRTCKGNTLSTGNSACPYDPAKIVGAIVVPRGFKLPADLDGDKLEELVHSDRASRVMPISDFVEYAKGGGEVNMSAVGYGPNQPADVSARTDTFTLGVYNPVLAQSLSRCMNIEYGAYFYDGNDFLYGIDDGTDSLAPFPMSSIYPTITSFPSSGQKSTLLVNFCHKDARRSFEMANFAQLGFSISSFAYGLVPVKFHKEGECKYKLVEAIGGFDRTSEFGDAIAKTPTSALKGTATGVTYDAETETLTIAGDAEPVLKPAAALFQAGIKGIEQAV